MGIRSDHRDTANICISLAIGLVFGAYGVLHHINDGTATQEAATVTITRGLMAIGLAAVIFVIMDRRKAASGMGRRHEG